MTKSVQPGSTESRHETPDAEQPPREGRSVGSTPSAVEEASIPKSNEPAAAPGYTLITPRFWHGMRFRTWMRLLADNRFAVAPSRWPMAASISMFSSGNSVLARLQEAIYGRRARRVELAEPPLFIIGHWRSGTTMLHELLVLDERHTYPTTYQCFAPHHFMLTSWLVTRWMKFLLPRKRPMDDMQAGWDRPQEDEFALCSLGVPSHYLNMAFPNHPPRNLRYLDLQDVSPEELSHWRESLVGFLKWITLADPRRVVLKSPTHTARLDILRELFPNAKFIHIVRDPRALYPSTVRLWKSLNLVQSMQVPNEEGVEQYVLDCFERMYGAYFAQRPNVPDANLCEVRYEDLIENPLAELERAYDQLNLGDFEAARPKLEDYFAQRQDYRPNRNTIAPEMEALLRERWAAYFDAYGYA